MPSSQSRLPRPQKSESSSTTGYFQLTRQPWHIFCFLLPLVIAYEAASLHYFADDSGQLVHTVKAQRLLELMFERFGVLGMHLPAAAMLTVLLLWHMLSRAAWKIRPWVLLGMAIESLVWTFPLMMLAVILTPSVLAQTGLTDLADWSVGARLTISVGAGLYEELLFRMVVIAAADFVFVDLLRAKKKLGAAGAVAVSAVAFGIYHTPTASGFDLTWFALYAAAGAYLGTLYLLRGFGIVVATHAFYDVLVLTIVSPQ